MATKKRETYWNPNTNRYDSREILVGDIPIEKDKMGLGQIAAAIAAERAKAEADKATEPKKAKPKKALSGLAAAAERERERRRKLQEAKEKQ